MDGVPGYGGGVVRLWRKFGFQLVSRRQSRLSMGDNEVMREHRFKAQGRKDGAR